MDCTSCCSSVTGGRSVVLILPVGSGDSNAGLRLSWILGGMSRFRLRRRCTRALVGSDWSGTAVLCCTAAEVWCEYANTDTRILDALNVEAWHAYFSSGWVEMTCQAGQNRLAFRQRVSALGKRPMPIPFNLYYSSAYQVFQILHGGRRQTANPSATVVLEDSPLRKSHYTHF